MKLLKWIDVNKQMPPSGKNVLVFYKNSSGKGRIVKAFYAERFSIESNPESDNNDEYMEEHDCYYLREGWYECVDNWEEFSSITLEPENKPTHWMELPKRPDS